MGINVLFWNTHRNKQINYYLKQIIEDRRCNFIVLTEYEDSMEGLCNELSRVGNEYHPHEIFGCKRIMIIANCCYGFTPIQGDSHYGICHVTIWGNEYIIAGVHFPSKIYRHGEDRQETTARILSADLLRAETDYACRNTIVIGDFNANPFEKSLNGVDCLHAISDRRIAIALEKRSFCEKDYRMLYNPMWNLLGDTCLCGGSYFYTPNGHESYYWNMFDQVLLHPQLINQFDHDSLEIVTNAGANCLLTKNGRPDEKISDHLPIFFSLKE